MLLINLASGLPTWPPYPSYTIMLSEYTAPTAFSHARQAIFIDADCAALRPVIDDRHRFVELILLDPESPLKQMAAWAEQNEGYDAIHLVSRGADARLYLGDGVLDSTSVMTQQAELAAIGGALRERGSLLVYGCDGLEEESRAFLALLGRMTGATVAGSGMLSRSPRTPMRARKYSGAN